MQSVILISHDFLQLINRPEYILLRLSRSLPLLCIAGRYRLGRCNPDILNLRLQVRTLVVHLLDDSHPLMHDIQMAPLL